MPIKHPHTKIQLLIVSITPYFLEKGNVWFEQNIHSILEARTTQPFFQENVILLTQQDSIALTELLGTLDRFGYEKVFRVDQPGEFSATGGILEVFPINTFYAFRIDFHGNTIECIEQLNITVEYEEAQKRSLKKRVQSQNLFSDIRNIKKGDYIVHLDHGVAQFKGIENVDLPMFNAQPLLRARAKKEQSLCNQNINKEKLAPQQFYVLEYAAQDKLFVPVGLERKLSRYVGFTTPKVSRLSSIAWVSTKRKIKKEVEQLAKELLALYAKRQDATRSPYAVTGEFEKNLETSFLYQETPDQLRALSDIKNDLQKNTPMDRLICGDVGFGKTEIALRAMVLAVENGKQAALLAPTTVLAHQHAERFKERLANTPIEVAMLSRLQTAKEQKEIVEKIQKGAIDIVVGTHRLLSKDITFHKLGILVIDDEQRFGVKQKEKLRHARENLDVLSLSATPIPRTLYMALSSLRNISIVQTPPQGRKSTKIIVARISKNEIALAIQQELERKGQVYYLHNRIGTIAQTKQNLQKLIPHASIAIAHARLSEKELLSIIEKFEKGVFDVLVATTIIENGLDIPNVNTLIVEDATKLGLAQAYQLKGRVGRSNIQARAYFFYKTKELKGNAELRLTALKEMQALGSGYLIAARDMEIRGAGNILGKEQSGSVNIIGLNLYCQMLSEAIERQRNIEKLEAQSYARAER